MSLTFFCSFLLLQLVSWSSLDCSVEASTSLRGKHDENDLTDTFSLSKNTSPRSLADETASVTTDLEPSTRIVNGQNAPQGRFPWFVRTLGTDAVGGIGACGGALIAPDMVLSAAHCDPPSRVMIGAYNLDDGQGGDRNVIQNIVHPSYPLNRSYTVNYDVSIAILDRPVTDVFPIKINFDDNIPSDTGEPLTMLGFGSTIGGKETVPGGPNQQARILQVAPTEYVSFDDCAVAKDPDTGTLWGNSNTQTIVQPHWFCTLLNDPLTTSTCYGDSGGPIILEGATFETDLLMAVISGAGGGYCGNPYLPLWNQRVSYHKDWIIETGCKWSQDPPAEWNCDQGGMAPDTNPAPVSAVSPTPPPTQGTTASPTRLPTRPPTARPTRRPNPLPTRPPMAQPTGPPVAQPTRQPNPAPTENDNDGNGGGGEGGENVSLFLCPVCGEGRNISRPNATVVVPILGEFLCGDLVAAAEQGEFSEGQCGIVQIVSVPCLCEPVNATAGEDGPTDMTPPSPSPGQIPSEPSAESVATLPPNVPTLPPIQLTEPGSAECDGRYDDNAVLVPITVRIQFDDSPEDIGWYIADVAYKCFRAGVPAMAYVKNVSSVEEVVYVVGGQRYMFVMEDSQGDGLCCGRVADDGSTATRQASRPGSYSVLSGDTTLVSGGGDFGSKAMHNFTAPEQRR